MFSRHDMFLQKHLQASQFICLAFYYVPYANSFILISIYLPMYLYCFMPMFSFLKFSSEYMFVMSVSLFKLNLSC